MISHTNIFLLLYPPRVSCFNDASGEVSAEPIDSTTGHLVVAGLPLLDEDVDVIVHVSTAFTTHVCISTFAEKG